MSASPARRQRGGVAILLLVAVLALGGTYYLVSSVNAMSVQRKAYVQAQNAAVLQRAKQALIGYVVAQAGKTSENDPGALPCPEAPAYFTSTTQDGQAAANCTLPNVGRFPWRTIGTDKLVDTAGEPLWYVVSPGWARPGSNTTINSNSVGQLTVDGSAGTDGDTVVALIIAPGPAISVIATAGCSTWTQARPNSGTPDWRNYLECENATTPVDATFVTTGPDGSFNDQVIKVTKADVVPGLEAAIAQRIERDIVPALRTVYASGSFGITGGKAVYPYAATWVTGVDNPGPNGCPSAACAGSTSYQGVLVVTNESKGLLPFNQTQGCTASANNPRCLPSLIAWSSGTPPTAYDAGGYGYIQTQSCSWQSGGDIAECVGEYHENSTYPTMPGMRIEMSATLNNVALGLRALDTTKMTVEARDDACAPTCPWQAQSVTYTATMNANGSVTIAFGASLPNIDGAGWGTYAAYRIRLDRDVMGDHPLLDPNNATTGWFVRNEWYRLTYYAVARGRTAQVLSAAPKCPTTVGGGYTFASSCLSATNVTPASTQAVMLILAGRSVNGTTRPSATLANYLEGGNETNNYLRKGMSNSTPRFNDRLLVVDSN